MVFALCSMVFACPDLKWNSPTDSLELFAGEAAITRGEHMEWVAETICSTKAVAVETLSLQLNNFQIPKHLKTGVG